MFGFGFDLVLVFFLKKKRKKMSFFFFCLFHYCFFCLSFAHLKYSVINFFISMFNLLGFVFLLLDCWEHHWTFFFFSFFVFWKKINLFLCFCFSLQLQCVLVICFWPDFPSSPLACPPRRLCGCGFYGLWLFIYLFFLKKN